MSNPFPSFSNLATASPELVPIVPPRSSPDNIGLHPQSQRQFIYRYPAPAMHAHYHPDPRSNPPPRSWPPGHPYSPYVPMALGSQHEISVEDSNKPKNPSKPKGPYGLSGGRRPKSKHSSCEPCRRKKSKCDKRENCSSCRMRGDVCVWGGGAIPVQPSVDLPDFPEASTQALREIARLRNLVHSLAARLGVDPNAPDSSSGKASTSTTNTSKESRDSHPNNSGSPSPSLSPASGHIPVLPPRSMLTDVSGMDDSRTPTASLSFLFDEDHEIWGYDTRSGFTQAGAPAEFPSWNEAS